MTNSGEMIPTRGEMSGMMAITIAAMIPARGCMPTGAMISRTATSSNRGVNLHFHHDCCFRCTNPTNAVAKRNTECGQAGEGLGQNARPPFINTANANPFSNNGLNAEYCQGQLDKKEAFTLQAQLDLQHVLTRVTASFILIQLLTLASVASDPCSRLSFGE